MSDDKDLRHFMIQEAYSSLYVMYSRRNKMYSDLIEIYWWSGLKHEVTDYMVKCLTCQQVKVEHQFFSGFLQPIKIPQWKWEQVTMDFVSELSLTPTKKDSF